MYVALLQNMFKFGNISTIKIIRAAVLKRFEQPSYKLS